MIANNVEHVVESVVAWLAILLVSLNLGYFIIRRVPCEANVASRVSIDLPSEALAEYVSHQVEQDRAPRARRSWE